jgi:hypothetical protein
MKRNITGRSGRLILNGLPQPWSTPPWRSARRIDDGAEQAQDSAAGAAENRGSSGSSPNGQVGALNRWEGEGGRTAVPGARS